MSDIDAMVATPHTWTLRIVKMQDGLLEFREVWLNESGTPCGHGPVALTGDNPSDMTFLAEQMQEAAKAPHLDYKEFGGSA